MVERYPYIIKKYRAVIKKTRGVNIQGSEHIFSPYKLPGQNN